MRRIKTELYNDNFQNWKRDSAKENPKIHPAQKPLIVSDDGQMSIEDIPGYRGD